MQPHARHAPPPPEHFTFERGVRHLFTANAVRVGPTQRPDLDARLPLPAAWVGGAPTGMRCDASHAGRMRVS